MYNNSQLIWVSCVERMKKAQNNNNNNKEAATEAACLGH